MTYSLDKSIQVKRELVEEAFKLFRLGAEAHCTIQELIEGKTAIMRKADKLPRWAQSELTGIFTACFEYHYRELEFCHIFNGEVYSIDKDTTKLHVKILYDLNVASVLKTSGFFYKNSTKVYTKIDRVYLAFKFISPAI